MPPQKHEREARRALLEMGCTDITMKQNAGHIRLSMRLPNGMTYVTSMASSPKNADNTVKEIQREVRLAMRGRTK